MLYFCYILFAFLFLQFIIAFVNAVYIQKFDKNPDNQNDLISVLIPARNEEKNIANILNDLVKQEYQNIEIIVFNDQSTDNTEKIVRNFSETDKRIRLLNSDILPDGWLGKNFACYSLAKIANGKYFLFLDADVRIYNNILAATISYSKKYKLGLLSIFPKQIMQHFGEKITVPIMNYILLTLLPLVLVRKSGFNSLSAANGQFMLFDAETYKKFLPHEKVKNMRVEDIEISRLYKKNKVKIACVSGKTNVTCRMYNTYNEAISGFSKNVTSFFGNSFLVALLFWLITSFGFVPILIFLPFQFFIAYSVVFFLTRIFVSYASCQNIFNNICFAVLQHFSLGHIILRTIINKKNNQLMWKERNVF